MRKMFKSLRNKLTTKREPKHPEVLSGHINILTSLVQDKLLRGWTLAEVWGWAQQWNEQQGKPLGDHELGEVIRSIHPHRRTESQVDAPVEIIRDLSKLPSVWTLDGKVEWLIDELIPQKAVTLLTSESGTGKTWLAHAISAAVSRGETFLGFNVKQCPVLYLDGENPLSVIRRNLNSLGIPETPSLQIWGGWVDSPPPGPESPIVQRFAGDQEGLVVYDPAIAFNRGEENSPTETRKFMDKFRALANKGATVLLLHHTGKSENSKEYRGSSDYKASVDMAYKLATKSTRDGKLHRLSLSTFKGRIAPGKDLEIEFKEGEGFDLVGGCDPKTKKSHLDVVVEIVRESPGSNQSRIKQLVGEQGVSKGKVEECLKDGVFRWERGKGAEKLYYLKEPNAPRRPKGLEPI